ncbi:cystathionine gamma-synthase [soil metagenome]
MTPVYFTSTFVQSAPGENQGYDYARVANPTRTALEKNLASLENARHGICFASGVGALDAILKTLQPGDHVVSTNDLYGGSYRLMSQVYARFGVDFTFIDLSDLEEVKAAITDRTVLVWAETPTNPLLRIFDIEALGGLARSHGADLAVDNTFASPYLQKPLDLSADLVLHSSTKYLGGHSDVVGGAVMTNSEEWADKLRFQVKTTGAVPSPMDSFLLLRSTKTLHLRMERHCDNAERVAEHLARHSKVASVRYPGLVDHPQHDLARRQMKRFGGMVSFELVDDRLESASRFMSSTRLFSLAESLGGVESLVSHPASMTHGSIPAEERRKSGLPDSLIRLSVGVEDADDLIDDIDEALAAVTGGQ